MNARTTKLIRNMASLLAVQNANDLYAKGGTDKAKLSSPGYLKQALEYLQKKHTKQLKQVWRTGDREALRKSWERMTWQYRELQLCEGLQRVMAPLLPPSTPELPSLAVAC